MRLTTKGRFAVTALLDVAKHSQGESISLSIISKRQNISLCYLEQLFNKLKKAGLVESIRGAHGGYLLSKDPKSINISEIITAVEDNMNATLCNGNANCDHGEECISHSLWETLSDLINDYLSTVTLEDVLNRKTKQKNSRKSNIHMKQCILQTNKFDN